MSKTIAMGAVSAVTPSEEQQLLELTTEQSAMIAMQRDAMAALRAEADLWRRSYQELSARLSRLAIDARLFDGSKGEPWAP